MRTFLLILALPLRTGAALVLLYLAVMPGPAQASEAPPVELAGKSEVTGLARLLGYRYVLDRWDGTGTPPVISLDQAMERSRASPEFTFDQVMNELSVASPARYRAGSYVLGPFWARLKLVNSGQRTARWRMDFRDPTGLAIRVFVVEESGAALKVLDNRWTIHPRTERFPYKRIAGSEIIEVPAGGSVDLWIDASYGLPSHTYWRLVEEDRFIADRQSDMWNLALLLGFRGALLLALLAFARVLGDRSALAYSGFHFGLILTSLSFAGFDTYWIGIDEATGMTLLRLTIGAAMVCYALTLRLFFATQERYPRYDRLLLVSTCIGLLAIPTLAIASMVLPSTSAFVITQQLIEAGVFLQFVIVAVAGALLGLRDRLPGASLFLLASSILLLLAVLESLHAANVSPVAPWQVVNIFGFVLALDGVVFAAALVRRALAIRAERDRVQAEKIAVLADRARLSDQLEEAQRSYQDAASLAEQRRRELASASHDLRQPLLSLQMTLARIEGAESAVEGVSYIEKVLQRGLDLSRPENARHDQRETMADLASKGVEIEPIIRNVTLMLEEEAASAGIKIIPVPSSARVMAEPVELLRILTNLVANAISHSGGNRVVVGVRRGDEGHALIVADNGCGIAPDRHQAIFAPYVAGVGSRGNGIGLAAVRDLATQRGWTVTVANLPSGGALFRIGGIRMAMVRRGPVSSAEAQSSP